jgi:hypothetical protein
MRTRLVTVVTAALFVVPLAATAAEAGPESAPRPEHTCAASTNLVEHQCPAPGTPPAKPKPKPKPSKPKK